MRRAFLATLAALTAAGVWLGRTSSTPDKPAVVNASAPTGVGAPVAGPLAADVARDPAASLGRPRSLRGTRTDGGLVVDADGRFVPTLDARRLFDYFLTASGEVSAKALRTRVLREIERRLPPEAAGDAALLFDRYLGYRERVRELATVDVPSDTDLEARLATLITIRREVLGPVAADAFFADEEADARRLLAARRIADDDSLSAEERGVRVEAIFAEAEAELPADVRAARATARLATTLQSAEAEIRARGGDDAAVAAVRERLAGPEAAARLAELDRQRAAWQGRVDAYRTARESIQGDPTLTADAQAAAVARLLGESFTPAERRRIEALDRIAADTAPSAP